MKKKDAVKESVKIARRTDARARRARAIDVLLRLASPRGDRRTILNGAALLAVRNVLRAAAIFLLCVLCGETAFAQTTVMGTITDPVSIPYSNCTIQATLSLVGGSPLPSGPTTGMNTPVPTPVPANCDVNGTFLMALQPNASITPAGTVWNFQVNAPGIPPPLGRGAVSFTVTNVTIAGSSQSLSAILNAAAPSMTTVNLASSVGSSTPGQALVNTAGSVTGKDIEGSGVKLLACTNASLATNDMWNWDGSKCVNTFVGLPSRADDDGTVAIASTDQNSLVTAANGTANAVSIAQAGSAGFPLSWATTFCTYGAGLSTITPATSTIWNGLTDAATLTLGKGDCATISVLSVTGNGKYFAQLKRGVPTRTAGTTNFLREDYTFALPSGGATFFTGNCSLGSCNGTSELTLQLATTGNNISVLAISGTVAALYARSTANLAGTDSYAITVYKNGASATMNCTILASTNTCSSTSNTFSVVAGDTLGYHTVCTGAGSCTAGGTLSISLKITGAN